MKRASLSDLVDPLDPFCEECEAFFSASAMTASDLYSEEKWPQPTCRHLQSSFADLPVLPAVPAVLPVPVPERPETFPGEYDRLMTEYCQSKTYSHVIELPVPSLRAFRNHRFPSLATIWDWIRERGPFHIRSSCFTMEETHMDNLVRVLVMFKGNTGPRILCLLEKWKQAVHEQDSATCQFLWVWWHFLTTPPSKENYDQTEPCPKGIDPCLFRRVKDNDGCQLYRLWLSLRIPDFPSYEYREWSSIRLALHRLIFNVSVREL